MKKLNMRNLLVNKKLTRLLLMMIMVPMVMATSCEKDDPEPVTPPVTNTCETEQNNLNTAIATENGLNNTFNVNADSCIHYYGDQMSATFLNNAYGDLPNVASEPYTKKDSVYVLNVKANNVPAQYQDDVIKGIIRTGGNALTAWDSYLNAQTATQAAQTAYTDCQNGN